MIKKLKIFNSDFIGLFCRAWNDMAIVPGHLEDSIINEIGSALNVPVRKSHVDVSGMYGVFSVMNSKGIIINAGPNKEVDFDYGERNILFLNDSVNAVGNDIIANDHGAMIHKEFSERSLRRIEDTLGVETIRGEMGTFTTVGSSTVVTNKGMLVNPEVKDDELELLSDLFKVPVKVGTANFGSPMLGSSIIANTEGILVGNSTTTIEIGIIDDVLS
jgi:translation initiation factor 6